MKKYITLIACLLIAASGLLAQSIDRLIINKKDGTSVTLLLKDHPAIAFEDNCMTVTTSSQTASEPITIFFDELDEMTPTAPASVDDIISNENGVTISIDGDIITFGNIGAEMQNVLVADVAGRVVVSTSAADTYTLSRKGMAHGVYVITIGTFTAKLKL